MILIFGHTLVLILANRSFEKLKKAGVNWLGLGIENLAITLDR